MRVLVAGLPAILTWGCTVTEIRPGRVLDVRGETIEEWAPCPAEPRVRVDVRDGGLVVTVEREEVPVYRAAEVRYEKIVTRRRLGAFGAIARLVFVPLFAAVAADRDIHPYFRVRAAAAALRGAFLYHEAEFTNPVTKVVPGETIIRRDVRYTGEPEWRGVEGESVILEIRREGRLCGWERAVTDRNGRAEFDVDRPEEKHLVVRALDRTLELPPRR